MILCFHACKLYYADSFVQLFFTGKGQGSPDVRVDEISKDLFFPLNYIINTIPRIRASSKFAEKIRDSYVWPSPKQVVSKLVGSTAASSFDRATIAKDLSEYVTSFREKLDGQATGKPLVANACKDTVDYLARFLCRKSKYIHDYIFGTKRFIGYDATSTARKALLFLIGTPGIGKTTFINHLLFSNKHVFDEKKVIFVRIGLNRDENRHESIKDCLLRQFIHIYRKHYYDKDRFRFSDNGLIREWIQYCSAKTDMEKANADGYAKDLIKKFQQRRTYDINLGFANALLDYLSKEKECSFLFVLDGMDYVTLDEVHLDDFSNWLTQLPIRLPDEKHLPGLYLVVMREYNYEEYKTKNISAYRSPSGPPHVFSILPGCLPEILTRKIDIGLGDAKNYIKAPPNDPQSLLINDPDQCANKEAFGIVLVSMCHRLRWVEVRNFRAYTRPIGKIPRGNNPLWLFGDDEYFIMQL